MANSLEFKLILDGDSKQLVTATRNSEAAWTSFSNVVKQETVAIRAASNQAADGLSKIASGDVAGGATKLANLFHNAGQEIAELGDKTVISSGEFRSMSSTGEQALGQLNNALKAAQAELTQLANTNGSPKDLALATEKVESIKGAIQEVTSSFNYYQDVASSAMKGVSNAAQDTINQVQKFSSVDLSGVVAEAQNATRSIQSMGDGATISTKEIERIGSVGKAAIDALEREFLAADAALSKLYSSRDTSSLDDIKKAEDKANGLLRALNLTKQSYSEFGDTAANSARKASAGTDQVASAAAQAVAPVDSFKNKLNSANKELDDVEPKSKKTDIAIGSVTNAFSRLNPVLAALGIGLSITEIAKLADEFNNLEAKIKLSTGEGAGFQSAMAEIQQIALSTRSGLVETGELFARINTAAKEMGLSQQAALELTETINKAMIISGGSAESNKAAITQFNQAMQSGVLRGEEFNSVMEQSPRLARALADGLGVTIGELRKMAENGELTAQVVTKALASQSAAIQAEFAKMPVTIGGAVQNIKTQWMLFLGEFDKTQEISGSVANALMGVANSLEDLKFITDDIAEAFSWVQDKIDGVDYKTIEALKLTLENLYDIVVEIFKTVASGAEIGVDLFDLLIGTIKTFAGITEEANQKTDSIKTTMQGVAIATGAIKDGVYGIRLAFTLLTGAVADFVGFTADAWSRLPFNPFREQLEKVAADMRGTAEKYYAQADQMAQDFVSSTKKALDAASGNTQAAYAQDVKKAQETWDEMTLAQGDFVLESIKRDQERQAATEAYNRALDSGNSAVIASAKARLDELNKAEQDAADKKADIDAKKLQAVKDYAEAQFLANGRNLSGAVQADLAAQGYIATVKDGTKVVVEDFNKVSAAADGVAISTTDAAKKAATSLGIDFEGALNRVSAGFKTAKASVNDLANGYNDLKAAGGDANSLLIAGLEALLKKAKNQAEIEEVRKLYIQFGNDGKLSALQVAEGLRQANEELNKADPNASALEQALKRLGVESRKNLEIRAQQLEQDLMTAKISGQVTDQQIKQAEETVAKARAAADGVEYHNNRVSQSYNRVSDAATGAGNAGVRAAQATQAAWDNTVTSLSKWADKVDEANKKAADLSKSNQAAQSGSIVYEDAASIKSKLTALGIDDKEAERKAKIIINKALADDKAGLMSLTGPNSQWIKDLYQPNIERGLSANTIINDLIGKERSSVNSIKSTVAAPSSPYTQIDNAVNRAANNVQNQPEKTVNVNLQLGGKTVNANIPASQEQSFLDMLKQAKRVS